MVTKIGMEWYLLHELIHVTSTLVVLVHVLVDIFKVGTVLALWMVKDLTCRLGDVGVLVGGLGLSPHLVIDYSWVCQYISPPSISKVFCFCWFFPLL